MAVMLLATALIGCDRNNADDPGSLVEAPDFVFVPEYIALPEDITGMTNLVYNDGRLFFSSWVFDEDEGMSASRLFSMGIDGTNLTQLPNYNPGDPPEGAMGSMNINSIHIDGDGNLWVFESGHFWGFDLPDDFDGEEWDMWEFQVDLGSVMAVRKLDRTGAEIMSVDISDLTNNADQFFLRAFNIDGDGNIYIAGESMIGESAIYVLHNDGRMQFRIEVMGWIDQLIRLPDGAVATSAWSETGFGRVLRPIDLATRGWGEEIDLPPNAHNVFPGAGEHALVFMDNSGLSGFDADTGETVRMLNWIDSDIPGTGLGNVIVLPDGRVICTNQDWDRFTGESFFELIILTPVPYDSLPPRTIMTLATVSLDWQLRSAIVNFNRTNGTFRIQVNDYSEFNTADDWGAGLTRLTTEIIAGRVPDILDVRGLPFHQYVSRGLLVDLYEFIDADPHISRADLMQSVFRAIELDGGLYQIFPTFSINTLIGNPAVLGEGMGWNMDEFREVLQANPQADMPFGMGWTRDAFLSQAIATSLDEYVDWAAGTTNFDSDEFIQLLEFANTFPADFEWDWENFIDAPELIADGRQIMMMSWVGDFEGIQMNRAIFGGDIVFKGFPAASRNGHALSIGSGLAITTRASDPQGAWQFLRTILTEDWQRTNVQWDFPTNRVVFDERLEDAMTPPEPILDEDGNEIDVGFGFARGVTRSMGWGNVMIDIGPTTQEDADQIFALIDVVSGTFTHNESLMNIINEGAEDFFAGRRSAQDAARIIQSRASILIAEQS